MKKLTQNPVRSRSSNTRDVVQFFVNTLLARQWELLNVLCDENCKIDDILVSDQDSVIITTDGKHYRVIVEECETEN
jgi:hypothetical protein